MFSSQEKPADALRPGRLVFLCVILAALGLMLCAALAKIQLIDEQNYKQRARNQSQRLVVLPAPRGNILDRHGRLIVGNRPCYNIVADIAGLQDEIKLEREILTRRHSRAKHLDDPDATLSSGERKEIAGIAIANVLQGYLNKINRLLDRNEVIDVNEITKHNDRRNPRRALPYTLVSDISEKELARFAENFSPDEPVRLSIESIRIYPYGTMAAHVLGYLKQDQSEIAVEKPAEETKSENYDAGDELLAEFLDQPDDSRRIRTLKKFNGFEGASGLESRFDRDLLRGTAGYELWTIRPNGYLFEKIKEIAPKQGATLFTSLDIDLQLAAEKSLATRLPGHNAAAVLLDVKTGEVLAMASAPGFDPARIRYKKYQDEMEAVARDFLFNRATQIPHPPGSTFKTITAIAGMRAGVIEPYEKENYPAYITLGTHNFREHNSYGYRDVDLPKMLEVSCNVYCYTVALKMGIAKLASEAERFGLADKSQIEIESNSKLVIASPAYKKKERPYEGPWTLGDTVTAAIGQSYTLTTPLNLACMYASVARNETHTVPTLVHDPATAQLPRVNHGGERIGLTDEQYIALLKGLMDCARGDLGTGRLVSGVNVPRGLGITVKPLPELDIAAKTGTSQIKHGKSHIAWVCAFAPATAPRVAICIMAEEGENADQELAGGKSAGPIANDILAEWKKLYFDKPPATTPAAF